MNHQLLMNCLLFSKNPSEFSMYFLVVKPQSEKQEVNPMGEKIHPMGYFKKTTCPMGWDCPIAFGYLLALSR
jgi:hypothetical protein